MSPKFIACVVISFLHSFFTVVWMGGMIVTLMVYLPAVQEVLGKSPEAKKVMAAFKRKQRVWVYVSITILLITGFLMSRRNPAFTGLFTFATPYSAALSIKHIITLAMIGISLYRAIVLAPKAPAMPNKKQGMAGPGAGGPGAAGGPGPEALKREKLNATLLIINVILAILVLLNSAVLGAMSTPMTGH